MQTDVGHFNTVQTADIKHNNNSAAAAASSASAAAVAAEPINVMNEWHTHLHVCIHTHIHN
jgi:hypothetical protein